MAYTCCAKLNKILFMYARYSDEVSQEPGGELMEDD